MARYLRVADAAALLGISPQQLRREIAAGRVRVSVRASRDVRISPEELTRARVRLARGEQPGAPPTAG